MRSIVNLLAGAALGLSAALASAQPTLKMMIPANPGGGWDTTGRALGKAMQSAKAGRQRARTTTRAAPPARIGLAQFVNSAQGRSRTR